MEGRLSELERSTRSAAPWRKGRRDDVEVVGTGGGGGREEDSKWF